MPGAMRILLILVALSLAAPLGCHLFKTEQPKQRSDWTAPPTRYGETEWEGLRSPGFEADAGTGTD